MTSNLPTPAANDTNDTASLLTIRGDGFSPQQIRRLTLCRALKQGDALGYFAYGTRDGWACKNNDQGAEDLLLCEAIYNNGKLRDVDGKVTNRRIVESCPKPSDGVSDGLAGRQALKPLQEDKPVDLASLSCSALEFLGDHYQRKVDNAVLANQTAYYNKMNARVQTILSQKCY